MLWFSFRDDAFRKNLESALRFGSPLLVQDVESYDPILNPVLNRELHRTGGRVLITLGDQDIDLSPSFTIFLSTRDPTVSQIPLQMIVQRSFRLKVLQHHCFTLVPRFASFIAVLSNHTPFKLNAADIRWWCGLINTQLCVLVFTSRIINLFWEPIVWPQPPLGISS